MPRVDWNLDVAAPKSPQDRKVNDRVPLPFPRVPAKIMRGDKLMPDQMIDPLDDEFG